MLRAVSCRRCLPHCSDLKRPFWGEQQRQQCALAMDSQAGEGPQQAAGGMGEPGEWKLGGDGGGGVIRRGGGAAGLQGFRV